MPWDIEKRGSQYCVVKRDDGDVEGCHGTRAEAEAQRRALHASEDEASAGVDTLVSVSSSHFLINPTSTTMNANGTGGTITFEIVPSEGEREEHVESERGAAWEGVLGIEGSPTADDRLLILGEIEERELPLPFSVQTATADGHDGAETAGRIESVAHIPLAEFEREDFELGELPENAVIIWGEGTFDTSPAADEGVRLIENGAGVSLDLPPERIAPFDRETLEEVDPDTIEFEDLLMGTYLMGIGGKIGGATIVNIPAFEEARVGLSASAGVRTVSGALKLKPVSRPLTAAAGPVKPPKEWFEDPKLTELTPLTITKEGRVYGHLADWDGCHIGFQGICVPPFRSASNYAHFNTGEIETAEGDLVPCGKIMFCREGNGHAPLDLNLEEASNYYDDATKVGAFVRAGSDRYGTWLAGALRADLTDLEIQHLRTHPPSGDWRPTLGGRGPSELIAAFAVPIGGFTIPRKALVASADGEITAIITAPLALGAEDGARRRRRQKIMLASRVKAALGYQPSSRRRMRQEAMARRNGEE